MAEGEVHKHLKEVAINWLKTKVTDLIATEVDFKNAYSIADAVGINLKRREVRVIECKATKGDFIRDTKLGGSKTSYCLHSHYAYIMCPVNVLGINEIPPGYGLLYVDEYDNVEMVKKPVKNTGRLKTMFDTTLRNTCRALTNTYLFHQQNKDHKDETGGKFSRKAEILYIAATCPKCRKSTRELIKKDVTKEIECDNCKAIIDISKAKVREITGFNKKFITRINKLNGGS